jgi:hypothetical protein
MCAALLSAMSCLRPNPVVARSNLDFQPGSPGRSRMTSAAHGQPGSVRPSLPRSSVSERQCDTRCRQSGADASGSPPAGSRRAERHGAGGEARCRPRHLPALPPSRAQRAAQPSPTPTDADRPRACSATTPRVAQAATFSQGADTAPLPRRTIPSRRPGDPNHSGGTSGSWRPPACRSRHVRTRLSPVRGTVRVPATRLGARCRWTVTPLRYQHGCH